MNAKGIFTIGIGLLAALWLMVQGLTGGRNAISESFQYLAIGLLILSFLQPKIGFWLVIVSIGYLDLLKKVLVIGDHITVLDITIILAFTPLLTVTSFAGIFVKDVLQGQFNREKQQQFLVVAGLGIALAGYVAVGGGGGAGRLKNLANYCGYVPLLYIVPALFPNREAIFKVVRVIVWLLLPVALYAYKQYFYGFTWWELAYLETGLSTESRILEGQDFRYFSLLNSSQNLSKVMALGGSLALILSWGKNRFLSNLFRAILFLLFYSAAFLSGSRSGILMGLVFLFVYFAFRFRWVMLISYGGGFAAFFFVVMVSDYVVESKLLNQWTEQMQKSVTWLDDNRRLNVATLTIRFESFAKLKDPDFWRPFGMSGQERTQYKVHDAFTRILIRTGYIPFGFVSLVVLFVMWKLHMGFYNGRDPSRMKLLGFAMFASIAVGGLSASENFSTFPINVFLYIFLGFIFVGYRISSDEVSFGGVESESFDGEQEMPILVS